MRRLLFGRVCVGVQWTVTTYIALNRRKVIRVANNYFFLIP